MYLILVRIHCRLWLLESYVMKPNTRHGAGDFPLHFKWKMCQAHKCPYKDGQASAGHYSIWALSVTDNKNPKANQTFVHIKIQTAFGKKLCHTSDLSACFLRASFRGTKKSQSYVPPLSYTEMTWTKPVHSLLKEHYMVIQCTCILGHINSD